MTDDTRTHWKGGDGTVCGSGSTMNATKGMRAYLPKLARQYDIHSVADVGCGDRTWIQRVAWNVQYEGFDIEHTKVKFNCITEVLPKPFDLILCLYVTNHFTKWEYVLDAIQNFRKSGSKYLLLTYAEGPTDREPWYCPIADEPLEKLLAHENAKWNWYHALWRINDV